MNENIKKYIAYEKEYKKKPLEKFSKLCAIVHILHETTIGKHGSAKQKMMDGTIPQRSSIVAEIRKTYKALSWDFISRQVVKKTILNLFL